MTTTQAPCSSDRCKVCVAEPSTYAKLVEYGIRLDAKAEALLANADELDDRDREEAEVVADHLADEVEELQRILRDAPEADTKSSASRQHYIDTGFFLPKNGA
jgi:hypothetical protein